MPLPGSAELAVPELVVRSARRSPFPGRGDVIVDIPIDEDTHPAIANE
jgi:hypothetical protein